jgi:hypothetical protein
VTVGGFFLKYINAVTAAIPTARPPTTPRTVSITVPKLELADGTELVNETLLLLILPFIEIDWGELKVTNSPIPTVNAGI